jgi:hypothetical protein
MFTESHKKVYAYLRSICPANKVLHIPDATAIASRKISGQELKTLVSLSEQAYQKQMMLNLHIASNVASKKTMIILS